MFPKKKKEIVQSIKTLDKQEDELGLFENERECDLHSKISYRELKDQEEVYRWQRSRDKWIKDGDRNTKYFCTIANIRKCKNEINEIFVDGLGVSNLKEIPKAFHSYFSSLPGDSENNHTMAEWDKL